MYIANNTEVKEYISNSVNDLLGNLLNINHSIPPYTSLRLIQDICRNYQDYIIQPYTYWVIRQKNDIIPPNITLLYDRLILLNSIDIAKDINHKLGICIHHQE